MLSVAASVSREGTQLPGRYYPTPPHPTPPHPTPPHLETMPCWVWPQVCERKERSCQDVLIPPHPTPPHLETMPCWVWLQVCQRKERSCQDVIIPPHPTPPPPPVTYFVLRVYTMLSCMLTCTLNSLSFMRTPHGSRLAAIRRIEKSAAAHAWLRWCTIVSRAPLKGKATSPPAAASTLLSHPTPPPLETMPCWLWLQVCQRKERSCQDVIIPPHPTPPPRIWRRCHVECGCKCDRGRNAAARTLLSHPTPPHLETPQVCQRKERSCQDVIIVIIPPTPPHLETMPCWVWPQVCQRKERSCQDVIIPPHPNPPASGDDAILSVAASLSKEGTQLPGRYYPTPPHPTPTPCYLFCFTCLHNAFMHVDMYT